MASERMLVITMRGRTTRVKLPETGTVVIGRSPDCDVQIDDKLVSRRHAALHIAGDVSAEDLGSHNGTSLLLQAGAAETTLTGGQEVIELEANTRQPLADDAIVQIGRAILTIEPAAQRRLPTHTGAAMIRDPAMVRIYELAERVAPSDLCVLLLGESGVGKDVLARFIHRSSNRASIDLVTLNCGALPENLIESELFGYEKGAFTGAAKSTPGLLETADKGTIFFDEVGELTPALQVKLLRVLEGKRVMRIGGRQPVEVDVRFIAATNRDLDAEVAAGRFREDLFYRLNGISLTIPPLRERRGEVIPLAERFLAETGDPRPMSDAAIDKLDGYDWPGNVRQLKNVIKRAAVLAVGDIIEAEHVQLPAPTTATAAPEPAPATESVEPADTGEWDRTVTEDLSPEGLREQAAALERARIIEALEACAGNQTRAAEMLGLTRRALVGRLNKYNIPRPRKGRKS